MHVKAYLQMPIERNLLKINRSTWEKRKTAVVPSTRGFNYSYQKDKLRTEIKSRERDIPIDAMNVLRVLSLGESGDREGVGWRRPFDDCGFGFEAF